MARYTGFSYDDEFYTPEAVRQRAVSIDKYRKEYQKLYRVAQKRLRSFENAGRTDAAAYRYNIDRIKPSTKLTDEQLGRALNDVYRMLTSTRGSVTGLRKWESKQVERFHDLGLTFINKGNLRAFGEFMEEARIRNLDSIYGSEQVVRLFGEAVRKGIDPKSIAEDFRFFMENREALQKLPKHKSKEARTADAYRKEIENASRKAAKKKAAKKVTKG